VKRRKARQLRKERRPALNAHQVNEAIAARLSLWRLATGGRRQAA